MDDTSRTGRAVAHAHPPLHRWECACDPQRPTLLAMYDDAGEVRIKLRDRFFFVRGSVRAICPKCGAEHALDARGEQPGGSRPPSATPGP